MNPIAKDILMHYGILGMKWGVRRNPEQLGRKPKYSTEPVVIKAGTSVYRITRTKKEKNDRDTFVFTDKKDAIKFGKEMQNLMPGNKLFMMDIPIKRDIIGPSEKERVDNFLKLYKDLPFVKDDIQYITTQAEKQGITLGVKGEDPDLLKYRAYTIAVAKNLGQYRMFSKSNASPIENQKDVKSYDVVSDDFMRGNTKLYKTSNEIDSLDSAYLLFARTRMLSTGKAKVSKFEHSGIENDIPNDIPNEPFNLWPIDGGNTIKNISISDNID
ncbi:MAG: hypothetical protein GX660_04240 [Clostridiaceae bacterium]|nr:hypothetical protein [Clostridiaceae bacterium]